MTLFYTTDFADQLLNQIVPALRAGFVVLTDRYIFSIMARAIARGEDRLWIEQVAGFALVPHAVYYLRAEVKDLVVAGGAGPRRLRFLGERDGHALRRGHAPELRPLSGPHDPGAGRDGQALRLHHRGCEPTFRRRVPGVAKSYPCAGSAQCPARSAAAQNPSPARRNGKR